MSVFSYSAKGKKGEFIKGTYEAADKEFVKQSLKSKGYIPIEIKQKSSIANTEILSSKVSTKNIAVFCRQFGTVIRSGIPIMDGLDIVRKQIRSKRLKQIIDKVYEEVQKGHSLSDGFKEFKNELPTILISLTEAGETSGALDDTMDKLAVYFETQNRMKSKVVSALIYPAIVMLVAFVAIIALLWLAVPQFQSMYSSVGVELPLPTQILLTVSGFVESNIVYILLGFIGAVIAFACFIKSKQGKKFKDKICFKIPLISEMYKKLIAARFSRTMASLLSSGIPLINSLELTDKVIDNWVVSNYSSEIIEDVTKGSNLSSAVSQVPFFPSMVHSMIKIGEESGSLDGILGKTADIFEEEANRDVDMLTTLIEPVSIMFLAGIVVSIALPIVLPMFDIIQKVGNY